MKVKHLYPIINLLILVTLLFTVYHYDKKIDTTQTALLEVCGAITEQQTRWMITTSVLMDEYSDGSSSYALKRLMLLRDMKFYDNLEGSDTDKFRILKKIYTTATRYGFPPDILFYLACEESGWIATAESSGGAKGLCQVLLSTANLYAKFSGLVPYTSSELFDPYTNIEVAAGWYAYLLSGNSNNLLLALTEYNTGVRSSTPNDYARRIYNAVGNG